MGSSRILVGRFGAAHGVRGEIRVKSFTAEPTAIAGYKGLTDETGARRFTFEAARFVKDDMIVARLKDVRDRNAAEALTNVDIYIDRADLPPPDEEEFYIADLVGLRAELADGALFGTVRAVLNFGAGDILEIETAPGVTQLLPFTAAVAPHVDMAGGRIIVAPPAEIDGEDELQSSSAPRED